MCLPSILFLFFQLIPSFRSAPNMSFITTIAALTSSFYHLSSCWRYSFQEFLLKLPTSVPTIPLVTRHSTQPINSRTHHWNSLLFALISLLSSLVHFHTSQPTCYPTHDTCIKNVILLSSIQRLVISNKSSLVLSCHCLPRTEFWKKGSSILQISANSKGYYQPFVIRHQYRY